MGFFTKLFQPGKIGTLSTPNRIVMAPMVTHYAAEGAVTERMIAYYAERAIGGTGLIVLEASYPRGVGHPGRVFIWSDAFIPGLKRLTDEVHLCGGKIAVEINPSRGRVDEADPISASPVPHPITGKVPRALTVEEIRGLEEDSGRSVIRAREAGFDAVMIHGGTGYLISEFLSPRINLRTDLYGGGIRGRARLAVEMVREAKKQGGEDYPIILRLAASERMEGGVSLEDIQETCRFVQEAGVDAIDVVSGVAETQEWVVPSMYFPPACNVPLAEEIKKQVSIPVMVAGRINDPSLAEEILEKGRADFVVLGRALLADPYFAAKAREGRQKEIRKCIACLRCIESFSARLPLVCTVNPSVGREREPEPKIGRKKKVAVVGGGPAGLQAALTAAERGHEVILLEKEGEMGGQLNLASLPPDKGELRNVLSYFENQLEKKRDKVKIIHREGTPSALAELSPDVVIAAVGSVPLIPNIPGMQEGIRKKKVVTGREVLSGKEKLGRRVIIIGGGMIACEVARYLAGKGHEVVLIEILPELAMDAFSSIRKVLLDRVRREGISAYMGVKEEKITEEGVEIVDSSGKGILLEADQIVLSAGSVPNSAVSRSFAGTAAEFYETGDCREACKILEAIHGGYRVARNL
jgi:2,4-dienoyl-CoA reductase-like NADH-dependent reductase (Old Yellow Enzyme family)/thioredoxin reductase